jgi:phospholipase C
MENHTNGQVIGSPAAPYETTLARQCGTASHYASVGSPSLPNYLGATSGSTWGIADDASPSSHPLTADNLFRQVRAAGRTERSYEEGMAGTCALGSGGSYAVKHNPAAYYTGGNDRAACQADDVPLGAVDTGALAHDLTADALPTFSFVTPDLCHDTHDCAVASGDNWLAQWVPRILSSPAYQSGATAVFIAWDEPTPMPSIVVTPSTPVGTVAAGSYSHYSLLRTTEELLGLPLLAGATGATSMRAGFHL